MWLSETSIGGLGIIEYLIRYYAEDPRRFWSLVADAQQPNDYEHTDIALTRLLRHVVQEAPHGSAAAALADLRKARSAADAAQALKRLRSAWADLDGPPRHSALAALATRIMRPGSSAETDAMSLSLVDEWAALEHQLGFRGRCPGHRLCRRVRAAEDRLGAPVDRRSGIQHAVAARRPGTQPSPAALPALRRRNPASNP